MEDLKIVFASNLIQLRTKSGMTQAELGGRINYSDKSISKWERAEALPDVAVVRNLSRLFGVSMDYMLESHDQWAPEVKNSPAQRRFNENMVTFVSVVGTLTLAVLLFVIFWIFGNTYWMIFICAVPAALITLLVFNSLWNEGRHNKQIVGAIVFCVFALLYYLMRERTPWQLIFALVPAELLVMLSFKIKIVPREDEKE